MLSLASLFSFAAAQSTFMTDPLFRTASTLQGHILLNCQGPGIDGYTSEIWTANDILDTVDDSQVLGKSVVQGIIWENQNTISPFLAGNQIIPPWATDNTYHYRQPSHWDSFGFQIEQNAFQRDLWAYAGISTLYNRHYEQTITAGVFSAGSQVISWDGYTCKKLYYIPATAETVACQNQNRQVVPNQSQCNWYQGFCACAPNQVNCYNDGCTMCLALANQCPPDAPNYRP
ncbi:hypothetical protein HDV01_000717 [Terramyces sp. JEL0728]|nr:hypothetical protein HDV01_000717 [Terramyces sp. JEL0728]